MQRFTRAGVGFTFVVAGTMATVGSVAAAEPANAADLSEVRVVGTRLEETLPEQLAQFGIRVDTLSREDVRHGSYVDVAQSLQALAPGLYLQPKNGPFDYVDISLLGSRTSDVLWLVDGVRLNNRLYSGTTPLDTIPSSLIDRIEVLEGGQSLLYGTQAVAGAVNVVTRSFSDSPRGGISLAADTHNGKHADGYFSTAFGANHIMLFASKDKSDGYDAFRREDYQPSATDRDRGYDVLTLGAKYAYDFTDHLRVSASYLHTDADLDFAMPYRVARDVNSREERLGTVKLDYAINENVGLYVKGYYHWWHTTYDTTYNSLTNPGTQEVLYDDAFWGFDDKGINALARFTFTPGVEYYLGYDFQRYGGADEVLVIEPQKEQTQAVFAQVRLTPDLIPNTHLAAGVRYNSPDVGEKATVWQASGQYDVSSHLFVRAALGTNFRLPSAEELFANDPLDERGNPNLRPERTKSLNLSIGGKLPGATTEFGWELIGFARDITDLIDLEGHDDVTDQDLFANVPGTVKVRGGELSLTTETGDWLSTRLSYLHDRSRADGGDQTLRVPEQLLKALVDFHPPARPFGATLAINYTGSVFTSVRGEHLDYGKDTIVDLSGRYFFDTGHKHVFNLSVQNVFDVDVGRPQQGCMDNPADGPYDCSSPYTIVNRSLPRTLRASYTYEF